MHETMFPCEWLDPASRMHFKHTPLVNTPRTDTHTHTCPHAPLPTAPTRRSSHVAGLPVMKCEVFDATGKLYRVELCSILVHHLRFLTAQNHAHACSPLCTFYRQNSNELSSNALEQLWNQTVELACRALWLLGWKCCADVSNWTSRLCKPAACYVLILSMDWIHWGEKKWQEMIIYSSPQRSFARCSRCWLTWMSHN